MLGGGQAIKLHCQFQILLNITAIFIANAEMKQRPFKGGLIKSDLGLGMIGCGILALFFLQLQTSHISHLCFAVIVGIKLASASTHN